jgi:hypothetical protein
VEAVNMGMVPQQLLDRDIRVVMPILGQRVLAAVVLEAQEQMSLLAATMEAEPLAVLV